MSIVHVYAADIVKAEKDTDGNLLVYGKATGPELDLDEQRCDPQWLKKAMPDWMAWGNMREMHQPIAAGVGVELAEAEDGWYLKSKVVDASCASKVEEEVYKGYSIGIKNPKVVKDATAPGGRIVGGTIVEVSYVDRPCNPTTTLAISKMAGVSLAPVDREGNILETDIKKSADSPEKEAFPAEDRAKAIQIVKAVSAQGAVDETPDIDGAEHVLQLLAKLIQAEAAEMAIGEWGETRDIQLLVDAACCMKCFLMREQAGAAHMDDAAPMSNVYLAAEASIIKRFVSAEQRRQLAREGKALPDGSYPIENKEDLHSAVILARSGHGDVAAAKSLIARRAKELGVPNPLKDSGKAAEDTTTKITEQIVKSAIAEANEASEKRIKALEAEIAKVKATPVSGGPALTVPADMRAKNVQAEKLAEAARFERLADQVTDSDLKKYYKLRAANCRAAA